MLTHRVLYRSRVDRVVAGVCGGLAHYLGLDPVIVRLGFVALTLVGGIGLPVYIVLALITPTALRAGVPNVPSTSPYDSADRGELQRRLAAGILLLIGAVFLLPHLGFTHGVHWQWFGPAVLIGVGVFLLARHRQRFD